MRLGLVMIVRKDRLTWTSALQLIDLDACFESLKLLGVADRAKVAKSWLHGWATSHRIKGDVLHNCLLGCQDTVDGMSHYLQCPRIYAC